MKRVHRLSAIATMAGAVVATLASATRAQQSAPVESKEAEVGSRGTEAGPGEGPPAASPDGEAEVLQQDGAAPADLPNAADAPGSDEGASANTDALLSQAAATGEAGRASATGVTGASSETEEASNSGEDTELSPYLAEEEVDPALLRPQALSLYGFFDFGFNKFYTSDKSQLLSLFPTRAGTFVLGNVNVFVDAQPWESWRALLEVRFTNLPHGLERNIASPLGDAYERDDSRAEDFTSPSVRGTTVLGSVVIERAQAEYALTDFFKLMGGYFFTPFGIWNVDHGTPTLISLLLPSFQADQYVPNRQLGLQAYGSFYTSSWELGYHAYIGNSRTPSQVDFTNDKTVGGRLFASSTGSAAKTKIGLSGFYGSGSDIEKRVVSFLPYLTETTQTVSFEEWAAGADLSLDVEGFRLRTEGLVRRIDYAPGQRDGTDPDHFYENGYVLASYRLPWLGLEPYAYFEAIHWPSALGDTVLIPSAGLNVHFNPAVQLKSQYARAMFFDFVTDEDRTPSDNNIHNIAARLVVSF